MLPHISPIYPGMTGTFFAFSSFMTPGLMERIWPERVMPPSPKIATSSPFSSDWAAVSKPRRIDFGPSFMRITPQNSAHFLKKKFLKFPPQAIARIFRGNSVRIVAPSSQLQ